MPAGVVDGSLRVYGTTNLRIVDASVIPNHIAGHIQATVYAVAEKVCSCICTLPTQFEPLQAADTIKSKNQGLLEYLWLPLQCYFRAPLVSRFSL